MSPAESLEWAEPIVREWFLGRFGSPTEPQIEGWPHIVAGRHTLISAPTGSGKTLAAFLACINGLVAHALAGTLTDRTEVLYVSPLKALGNDIQKNLDGPLAEIVALARAQGRELPRDSHGGADGRHADAGAARDAAAAAAHPGHDARSRSTSCSRPRRAAPSSAT